MTDVQYQLRPTVSAFLRKRKQHKSFVSHTVLLAPRSIVCILGTLRVWDVDTGVITNTIHGHSDAVTACATAQNGTQIISGELRSLVSDAVLPTPPHCPRNFLLMGNF